VIIIDASAAVEYLLRTELGFRIEPVIDENDCAAPELLDAEVMAVVRREVLSKRLMERRATEAIADLRDWGIERIPHRALLEEAWSLRNRVSAYDALYVAAARSRSAALVTADGPLARAPGLGITVHHVRLS
jgi:predicted nucleic acid-binding protein